MHDSLASPNKSRKPTYTKDINHIPISFPVSSNLDLFLRNNQKAKRGLTAPFSPDILELNRTKDIFNDLTLST